MNRPNEIGVEEKGGSGAPAPENFLPRSAARAGVALERALLFATWLVPVLEHFPRSQRFLLGDRLQTLTLDIIEALIEASCLMRSASCSNASSTYSSTSRGQSAKFVYADQ